MRGVPPFDPGDLAGFGVTRVGDLTGLDIVGLPVWFACRPNAFALSQTQGKGLTDAAARRAAVMEAAEHHHAERADRLPGTIRASLSALGDRGSAAARLASAQAGPLDLARERLWCPAASLTGGPERLLPYEAVGLDFRVDAGWDRSAFRFSTVGLGAGSDRTAATLHALLEVIENNATLLLDTLGLAGGLVTPIAPPEDGDAHEGLADALDRVRAAGLSTRFASVPNAFDLPVVAAHLHPPPGAARGAGGRAYGGYACRPDPRDAALAALLEAAQSRLTDIAGDRDDIDPPDGTRPTVTSLTPDTAATAVPLGTVGTALTVRDAAPEAMLDAVLARLSSRGIDEVLRVDLAPEARHYAVVRVVCPDLEHGAESGPVSLGVGGIAALLALIGQRP